MPCFKTVGTGLEVKVSKEVQSKAKQLFNEYASYKKPTKLKKESKLINESLVKTAHHHSESRGFNSKPGFLPPDHEEGSKVEGVVEIG